MPDLRTYAQACPVAHALDMVGERWALLIVRELRLGPRRYVDLQANLPRIGPSVLTKRLRDLEGFGVIRHRQLPSPVPARVYELTDWGAQLEPVFAALASWGLRSPSIPLRGEISDDAVMLGLRTSLDRCKTLRWSARYRIHLERETYTLEVERGAVVAMTRDSSGGAPSVSIRTTAHTLQELLLGTRTADAAIRAGHLQVDGDGGAAKRLLDAIAAGGVPRS